MQNRDQNRSDLVFRTYKLAVHNVQHMDKPRLYDVTTVCRKALTYTNSDAKLNGIQRTQITHIYDVKIFTQNVMDVTSKILLWYTVPIV
jgi:hypothetical protein